MSHEPECTFLNEPESVSGSCWCCAGIRAAYQRGREDAAEAVNNDNTYGCCDCVHDREKFVRIARGDSEQ